MAVKFLVYFFYWEGVFDSLKIEIIALTYSLKESLIRLVFANEIGETTEITEGSFNSLELSVNQAESLRIEFRVNNQISEILQLAPLINLNTLYPVGKFSERWVIKWVYYPA